jgi:5-methyltetrahydrofolate--homocysteine methyltransferase
VPARGGRAARLAELLRRPRALLFDGSMGTLLQGLGLPPGGAPEEFMLSRPEVVAGIHRQYVAAGAEVIETNTFGANRRKLAACGLERSVARVVGRGVALAREAAGDRALVALSLGPTGLFLEPVGPLGFEEAVALFREPLRAGARAGADLAIIETMSDLLEVRAAAVAAREAGLPFAVTMTFDASGRTLLGTPPEAAAAACSALGAALVGANCSLGPRELVPIAASLVRWSRVPVLVQPNAGLPRLDGERTVFPVGPEEFAGEAERLLALGVRAVGGCCGTTPEHVRTLARLLARRRPARVAAASGLVLASRTTAVRCGPGEPLRLVGERLNPTGRKRLSADLAAGEMSLVRTEAAAQVAAGADFLTVNAGVPGIDEARAFPALVRVVQNTVGAPLVLDSLDPAALAAAVAVTAGRPLLNSVNGKPRSIAAVLPLAARHGVPVLILPVDASGVPATARGRLAVARRVVREAERAGLSRDDLAVDGLMLTAGADPRAPRAVLDTLRAVREELGVCTILGVSNVSFGLPARSVLNAAMLPMAVAAGLDIAIVNTLDPAVSGAAAAADALLGRDPEARRYVARYAGRGAAAPAQAPAARDLGARIREAVVGGDASGVVPLVESALAGGSAPMAITRDFLVPGLEDVGERFASGEFFLPQVMAAAEAAKAAFARLKREPQPREAATPDLVLLATVEGDIHDIGKNIVATLLENHGFGVLDLGTGASPSRIAAAAAESRPRAVGLSALMTTTLPAMEATIRRLRETGYTGPVAVGGAVVTEDYARRIGADGWAPDATAAVRLFRRLLGR